MSAQLNRKRVWWAVVSALVLLIAFATRSIWLDRHPLWWDEGLNVYFAHQGLPDLLSETRITHDANPPLYRLGLGQWKALVGSSAFTLRLFSVFLGTTTVALTLTIGRWLADRKTALLGGLLMALAPLQVHYGREVKGYAFAAACGVLSIYAWGRKLGYFQPGSRPSRGSIGWWLAYVLSTAAALAAHYYLGLLILWQGLWVVGSAAIALARDKSPPLQTLPYVGRWILAMTLVALLLLPWVLLVFGTTSEMVAGVSTAEPLSILGYLARVGSGFSAGPGEEGPVPRIAGLGLVGLSLLGLRRLRSRNARAFLLTWIGVALIVAYGIQSVYSFFSPRFLLYLGPACYLLAAGGIVALGRRRILAVAALTIVLIGFWSPYLARVYTEPFIAPDVGRLNQAEEPRPAMARLCAMTQPGDALVYVYIWQVGYIHAYCPRSGLEFYRAYYTAETVGAELESIFASHPRVWLLGYRIGARNPDNLPASWLRAHAYRVEGNWFARHHLALYLAPDYRTPGAGPEEGTASFDGRIELHYPTIQAKLRPGDVLALPLRWQALKAGDENYHVFVHVGQPGTPPVAQSDGIPHNGLRPTNTWELGQEVMDRRALRLPQSLPSGRYQVLVGLYRPSDGSRLPVDGSGGLDALPLGHIEVLD